MRSGRRPGVKPKDDAWARVEKEMMRRYSELRGAERAALVREVMERYGMSERRARRVMRVGRAGASRAEIERRKRKAAEDVGCDVAEVESEGGAYRAWSDGSRRAADEEIMRARTKPPGCSDARWRIELARRSRVAAGCVCNWDPEWEYRVGHF